MRNCDVPYLHSPPASLKRLLACTTVAVLSLVVAADAYAEKRGGILRLYNSTNPPSGSVHEESTIATVVPYSAVFNNLVVFDPTKPVNSLETIIPDLAESWSLDSTRTKLTFKLQEGVKWHDGKPFTARDVVCTIDRLTGKEEGYFRRNPRKVFFENITDVVVDNDHQVTINLGRPQPSLLAMFATLQVPMYPCHVNGRDMRINPIGTGPFKFVSFQSNRSITFERNPDYWKTGYPLLDGIEWKIVGNRSTRLLAFRAGEFDMSFVADVTAPLLPEVESVEGVSCKMAPTNAPYNLIINRERAPFDDATVRRAAVLAIDRSEFIKTLTAGQGQIGAWMMPGPIGRWALPPEEIAKLPGYDLDVVKNREEARKLMAGLGYGPDKKLPVKVSTRSFTTYRDAATLLVSQLNEVYFAAELEIVESSLWYGRLARHDYSIGLNLSGVAIDDPDVSLGSAFACNSTVNRTKYCNPQIEALLLEQSQEADFEKRRNIVWQIERVLAEDVARPLLYHNRAATCWRDYVKGYVHNVNSLYNNWRFEKVWLDK
jgi:peptide/nickel transport system substrate-binding protein